MITTLFFDIGGVVLSNGWDRDARRRAAERFALDFDEFDERHAAVVGDFETGRMDLDTYLEKTVFFERRAFAPADFKAFMLAQSHEDAAPLALVRQLRQGGRYRLAAINNESLELNRHRIERFRLRECFSLFFSSCFVRLLKPNPAIYRLALDVTQTPPQDAFMVDDRAINVEAARRVGMHAIHFHDVDQLRASLADLGVDVARSPEPANPESTSA